MCCFLTSAITLSAFMPNYLTDHLKLSLDQMGFVLAGLGVGSFVGMVAIPTISDRLGRKSVMIGSLLIEFVALWVLMGIGANPPLLFAVIFITAFMNTGVIAINVGPLSSASAPRDRRHCDWLGCWNRRDIRRGSSPGRRGRDGGRHGHSDHSQDRDGGDRHVDSLGSVRRSRTSVFLTSRCSRIGRLRIAAPIAIRAQVVMPQLAFRDGVSGRSSSTRSCMTLGVIRPRTPRSRRTRP
jgi:hypothetical protein